MSKSKTPKRSGSEPVGAGNTRDASTSFRRHNVALQEVVHRPDGERADLVTDDLRGTEQRHRQLVMVPDLGHLGEPLQRDEHARAILQLAVNRHGVAQVPDAERQVSEIHGK